jgi:hypothetical protein
MPIPPALSEESELVMFHRDDFVLLTDDIKSWIVRIEDIALLKAWQNSTLVHFPDGKLLVRRSLADCERRSHWRNSRLKQMLSATRNVEMRHRSICLPDFPAVSHVRRYALRVDHSGHNTNGQRGVSGLRNKACSTTIRADFRQLYDSESGLSLMPHYSTVCSSLTKTR